MLVDLRTFRQQGCVPCLFQGNHLAKARRHHVVLEGGDLQEADYYSDASRVSSLEEQSKLQETFQDRVEIEHKKELRCKEFKMPLLGNIVFEGQLMPASEMYGCFMTMSKSYSLTADLPENFRVSSLMKLVMNSFQLYFATNETFNHFQIVSVENVIELSSNTS